MRAALLGIWMGLAAVVAAAEEDGPAVRAVAYLEALQDGDQEVEEVLKGTLLSQNCSQSKRKLIRERLQRLAARLRSGKHALSVMDEKRDGEYASVLVSAVGRNNPYDVEAVPIGLRRDGGAWRVAPVPGSFENAGVPYRREVERRVVVLEEWMGQERVLRREELQASALKVLEERMARVLPEQLLRDGPPVAVVDRFVEACEAGDLASILVFCREGMSAEELDELIGQVDQGLRWTEIETGWHELTSPDMVRVAVQAEEPGERNASVAILCLDPEKATGPVVLPFDLLKVGEHWQIVLPRVFRVPGGDSRTGWRRAHRYSNLEKKLPEAFERSRPVRRFVSVEEAAKDVERLLKDGTLEEFFRMVYRGEDMTDGEKRIAYAQMARVWKDWRRRDPGAPACTLVDVLTEGTAGLAVLRLPPTGRLDRMDMEPVLFLKDPEGWAVAPGVMDHGNYEAMPEEDQRNQHRILARFMEGQSLFAKKAAVLQMQDLEVLRPAGDEPVSGEDAAQLVRAYRRDLREGKLPEAMARCGLLDRAEGSLEGLRALAYESRGARRGEEADQELLVDAKDAWAGVSLRVDSGPADEPDYPLYLVLRGENGLRIAADAGLRLPTNPGRGILNGDVWEHLEASLEKKDVGLVRALFEGHRKRTLKDFEEWEKSNKSSR